MERSTRQRTAIRDALERAKRPLLPQEVLNEAQADVPALGLATVYRTVKAMVEEGDLRVVELPGENPRFELGAHHHHHHHHFQCMACKRVFDVHECPGDLQQLAPPGFVVQDHDITLYGQCADCAVMPAL
jgi:Fur family transcriptional regulator, ferric uptake regulator